ncbi:aminopeptidase P N-terminal domain-containing protein [Niabella beijingensis]|uniref:aminopeptidase P N-terminal domain-containing protein n=1 Tax=Niabella beijingensis TaxID=2872700 RepID=UPI001CBE1C4C|nr:aminopeptidase P N-terminal domain-containing protein [Niabella beijingensis]MBZ4191295.1 M24 family metallopeptidase [Niabella beijingensis]
MYFTQQDIEKRRARLTLKWDAVLNDDEAVLIYSGDPVQKPGGLDQTYPFLPHPAYYWLTGRRREGEVLCYNKNTGWTGFQKQPAKEEAVWEGVRNDLLVISPGRPLQELEGYLQTQQYSAIYELGQTGRPLAPGKTIELRTLLDQTKRVKDAAEIALIRQVAAIAERGYEKLEQVLMPGICEKELQLLFETEIVRNGAHTVPYETIVGAGSNSAILHALPTQRTIGENEFVLIDAGAAVFDYCVDITRTFGSSHSMDSRHKMLYELVLKVQLSCIGMTLPGAPWHAVHMHAAESFTTGLLELGILKGGMEELLSSEVIRLFFPHGVGHLVGLGVRDTGQEERRDNRSYYGSRLRVDLALEPGHLITVEPGLYFIPALLNDAELRNRYKNNINWQELEYWMEIGGVRIEDNILLTDGGNENLTGGINKQETI